MKRLLIGLMVIAGAALFGGAAGASFSTAEAHAPKVLVKSVIDLNVDEGTVTLPIFRGSHDGQDVWYIVTESSNRKDARARGVNWAPKLANALSADEAVQDVTVSGGVIQFQGTVDFSPTRVLVPGPTGFPPAQAEPGAVGDAAYSPLITTGDGIVLNAPQIANGSGLHDRVISIDFVARQVTLALVEGFYEGHDIYYISTEATDSTVAVIERSTFAPNLNAVPGLASNDPETSARAGIIPIVNGPTGIDNPERQGLQSALMGEGGPLNITQERPKSGGSRPLYSPLWDAHPAVWTDAAIAAGERHLLDDHEDVARLVEEGLLVSAGAGPANPDLGGLRALGVIINCPILAID
jgi:hypothetical protein